jgi:SAM-dependent methyltransferase
MKLLRRYANKLGYRFLGRNSARSPDGNRLHTAYLEGGRVPWSEGYSRYRNAVIEETVSRPSALVNFGTGGVLPSGYGVKLDERCIEIPWIFTRFPTAPRVILDAGCAYLKFDSIRRRLDPASSVTLLTLDKRDMAFPVTTTEVHRLEADMRNVPLEPQTFDVITCVSTLEHVGMDNTQLYTADDSYREQSDRDYLKALEELARLLKPGGDLFATVPYGARKNHGWLQVFDLSMLDSMVAVPGLALVEEAIYQHQSVGWVLAGRETATQAVYFDVHAVGANAADSSLAAAEAVACLWFKRK